MGEFESGLAGDVDGELFVETQRGRTLALTFHPMADGGGVVLFEDITDRKMAEAKIHQLARYDSLTGLPNRALFRDQMDASVTSLRRRGPFAIHFIDLDEFKQVNDTLGHPCGDELLCAVADRLRTAVRSSDIVARFGGDEFVILQYPLGHPKEAAALAERLVDRAGGAVPDQRPRGGGRRQHRHRAGAARRQQRRSAAEECRHGALSGQVGRPPGLALLRARHGRDGAGAPQPAARSQERAGLQRLQIHYQPLFNLHTKRISTCEALLRWPHPVRGMVSPAEFIPVAEEMGLIVEIGNLVLREACLECAKWPDDVRVAVNMSPIQFRRGNVADGIREALAAAKLPASRLEIEITESVFLNDTELTRHWLDELQEMGVRISLDDFGTGYSSLSYLHNYPLNKVKIDRSFLQGVDTSRQVAQPAAQRCAPERRSRHVGGGGGDRDGGAVRPGRTRDQRRRGAGLPDRLPPCPAAISAPCCARRRPASPRSRDPHSQRGAQNFAPPLLAAQIVSVAGSLAGCLR